MSMLSGYKKELTVLLSDIYPTIYIVETRHDGDSRIRFFIFRNGTEGIEHHNVTDFVMRVIALSDLRHEMDKEFQKLPQIQRIFHNTGQIQSDEYDSGLFLGAQSGFHILRFLSRELYGNSDKLTGVHFS